MKTIGAFLSTITTRTGLGTWDGNAGDGDLVAGGENGVALLEVPGEGVVASIQVHTDGLGNTISERHGRDTFINE